MIRTTLILVLTGVWLSLVYFGKKERLQYVSEHLPVTQPDQFTAASSSKLFLSGWSASGLTGRGSNSAQPSICFRPEPSAHPGADRLVVTIDAKFIAPLVGRTIHVSMNDRTFDYPVRADSQQAFEDEPSRHSATRLVCLKFKLPISPAMRWNFRGLGIQFDGLRYRYVALQP